MWQSGLRNVACLLRNRDAPVMTVPRLTCSNNPVGGEDPLDYEAVARDYSCIGRRRADDDCVLQRKARRCPARQQDLHFQSCGVCL